VTAVSPLSIATRPWTRDTDAAPRTPSLLASRSQLVRKKPCDNREYLKTRLKSDARDTGSISAITVGTSRE